MIVEPKNRQVGLGYMLTVAEPHKMQNHEESSRLFAANMRKKMSDCDSIIYKGKKK